MVTNKNNFILGIHTFSESGSDTKKVQQANDNLGQVKNCEQKILDAMTTQHING